MNLEFKKPILVYIPCHNCEKGLPEVFSGIPSELQNEIECLILDNYSTDGTLDVACQQIKGGNYPFKINLVRTKQDIDYAGSQKLAYSLACKSPEVKYVVMLHGDGQYPSSLLMHFTVHRDKNYAVVNGYRDKKTYPDKEETPFAPYYIIKALSLLESLATGCIQKEWHSGFVMYSKEFLKKIPLRSLSNVRHIDGEFLMCAGILKEKTLAVPIYKKFNGYKAFTGIPRVRHVMSIFKFILKFQSRYYHRMLKTNTSGEIDFDFDVIA